MVLCCLCVTFEVRYYENFKQQHILRDTPQKRAKLSL
jgi:hypothetical protein